MYRFGSLLKLDLHSNRLTAIPTCLTSLGSLLVLDLSDNQIVYSQKTNDVLSSSGPVPHLPPVTHSNSPYVIPSDPSVSLRRGNGIALFILLYSNNTYSFFK